MLLSPPPPAAEGREISAQGVAQPIDSTLSQFGAALDFS